jgi:hypothetical protein
MRRLVVLAALAACAPSETAGMMMGDDTIEPDASVDPDVMIEPPLDVPPPMEGNEDLDDIPSSCATGRATADRPDDSALDQIHVLYVVPSDVTDAQRDTSGQICNSIRGLATWFHDQSDVFLRWDTYNGALDIGFVRLSKTDAQMRGNDPTNQDAATGTAYVRDRIELELLNMGKIKNNKLYAVYYEGTSVYACGGGAYPPAIKMRVGAMYLNAVPQGLTTACQDAFPWGTANLKPSYIDYGLLHELVHSMGIVPDDAPNEIGSANPGHVFDASAATRARDLMYSPRPSTTDAAWATNDPNGLLLDVNRDDYFDATSSVEMSELSIISPLPPNAQQIIGWPDSN